MAKAALTASWIKRWRRRAGDVQTDWGDLGTAIGLEMSLEPPAAPIPLTAKPDVPARRWWRRLISAPTGIHR